MLLVRNSRARTITIHIPTNSVARVYVGDRWSLTGTEKDADSKDRVRYGDSIDLLAKNAAKKNDNEQEIRFTL